MIFVVGARGRLGAALLRTYGPGRVAAPDRATYDAWWQPGSLDAIRAFFAGAEPGSTIYVASGTLDPRADAEAQQRVNYLLPRHIVEATAGLGLQVVTFGTVMETLLARPNAYVASKMRLADYMANARGDALHLRIHTLYGGGPPAPFMFLGQMLDALRDGVPFRMTSGSQLREYHHVDDEAAAIVRLAAGGARGLLDLSHGQPVRLAEIAQAVFTAAGRPELLQVGALPEPAEENYRSRFRATPGLESHPFRSALEGIPAYLRPLAATH